METINSIAAIFNHPIFTIVGGITTISLIIGVFIKITFLFLGITPIIFRLGNAIWNNEVAIFASDAAFGTLRDTLINSKIFKGKNIIQISGNDIDSAIGKTIFLLDWETFGDKIDQVLRILNSHKTAMVIYAKPGSIPNDKMSDIANRANTVVVNFRGRLLNDILTSLMTVCH
ncbi:hypothetical protein MBAV_005998 [Candidatus Magnetobacterium bavaricum]|uniref:Uncharacterized protein n=1 Tax=Candidatus Magnetobacterium bavaricum TaxID=29290 RepID=A0A0F3GIN8_9BACT|nr:hypothetical protein MBAV_005998 [Candidatus Magnetobacterium bavaricum]